VITRAALKCSGTVCCYALECWQLHDKTNKHKQMSHCRFNFIMYCTNWISGETVMEFQLPTCITLPGKKPQFSIILLNPFLQRRFELSISRQFNTKAVSNLDWHHKLNISVVPDKSYQNIPTLPSNFVVLSFQNDGLTSFKFPGEDTRTYGRMSLPPAKEIWKI